MKTNVKTWQKTWFIIVFQSSSDAVCHECQLQGSVQDSDFLSGRQFINRVLRLQSMPFFCLQYGVKPFLA